MLYQTAEHAFFVYEFAKSDRSNIEYDEEIQFKKMASHVLGLSDEQLARLIKEGHFSEVTKYG
ncbi:hypothetical protein C6H64_10105 [Photorhabdus luminescens]|nr:hypothetical protein C6H64_10105 [Photorhabdus luminescens]PQQ34530.1 hypothetical protein C6H69_04725 [Photorhabdus luminescens]